MLSLHVSLNGSPLETSHWFLRGGAIPTIILIKPSKVPTFDPLLSVKQQ